MKSEPNPNWWMKIDPQFNSEEIEGVPELKKLLKENDALTDSKNQKFDENFDDVFFDQLHDKIMSGIENRSIDSDRGTIWSRNRSLIKKVLATAVMVAFVLVGKETTQKSIQVDSTDTNLSDAVNRSESVERTILVYQHKDDFLVDLAQKNLDHFLVINMQEILGSGKID